MPVDYRRRRPFKPPLVLRQPPPPVRLPKGGSPMHGNHSDTLGKTEEEDKTKSCSKVAARRTRPFFFRRCKSKMLKSTNTALESLPDEMILEILVRVPAEDLYNATRFVCRKWYKIIRTHDFVHAHLQQWNCGILAYTAPWPMFQQDFLASGQKSLVDLSKILYKFERGVMSSCNGLVLEIQHNFRDLYITNPVTMQSFALPPFPYSFVLTIFSKIRELCAIGYATTSKVYKVVHPFYRCKSDQSSQDDHRGGLAILTVGVDKEWTRVVNTRHLSLAAMELFSSEHPLTTQGGFVHWTQNECVLTLDLETEIITQFPIPRSSLKHRRDGENDELVNFNNYYYLPMGRCLTLLIVRSLFSWEFWEMHPKTGEWTKQPDIDFEAQFAGQLNCVLVPGGWLKFREVLVFNMSFDKSDSRFPDASPSFFACNIRTHEFLKFELLWSLKRFIAHSKTLEWLV